MLYHCLLVGLQDLSLDTKQRLTPEQLETEIRENLSGRDLKAFDMELFASNYEDELTMMKFYRTYMMAA